MKNITNNTNLLQKKNTKQMVNAEDMVICEQMVNLIHNDAVPTEALNDLAELTEKYDLLNALLVIAQKHSPYFTISENRIIEVYENL